MELAQFMCSLIDTEQHYRFADLMAGNCGITQYLPGSHILAVEKNRDRFESGRRFVTRAKWLNLDIFSVQFCSVLCFCCASQLSLRVCSVSRGTRAPPQI